MFQVTPVRVLLVDDHDLVREGIRLLLEREPDLEVVGEASTGEAAIEQLEALNPDVILMDVRMPGCGGIEATRQIVRLRPSSRVLILSAFSEHAAEALSAGAAGYVMKKGEGRQLIAAIRAVALGATVIDSGLSGALLGTMTASNRHPGLTDREADILSLVANGLTNRSIARQLRIAPRTADQHVHNILVKIGVRSRSAAVRYAIEQRLTPSSEARLRADAEDGASRPA